MSRVIPASVIDDVRERGIELDRWHSDRVILAVILAIHGGASRAARCSSAPAMARVYWPSVIALKGRPLPRMTCATRWAVAWYRDVLPAQPHIIMSERHALIEVIAAGHGPGE